MKRYKTAHVVAELFDNPELKFELIGSSRGTGSNIVGMNPDGNIDWYDQHKQEFEKTYLRIYGTLHWEWQRYQEPVDFITALNSDKRKRPQAGNFNFKTNREWFDYLSRSTNYTLWVNGLWEIEP